MLAGEGDARLASIAPQGLDKKWNYLTFVVFVL